MTGISVIMPSYLGKYPGSRSNPEEKFIRAVKSFQQQTHLDKELVIVSDGCEITNGLYQAYFKDDSDITIIKCEKRKEVWPGELREAGRSLARYDWITYLDSDDVILENHLKIIAEKINELHESERLIFNSAFFLPLVKNPNELYLKFLGMDKNPERYFDFYNKNHKIVQDSERIALCGLNHRGSTWQITHHINVPARWKSHTTHGEDGLFSELLKKNEKWSEYIGEYLICHYSLPGGIVIWDI